MDIKDLKALIAAGESQTVEFKESFGDVVIETLVAMANASGGKILIGIRDDGSVCGIAPGKPNVASWVNDIKMKTSPALFPAIEVLEKWNILDSYLKSRRLFPFLKTLLHCLKSSRC